MPIADTQELLMHELAEIYDAGAYIPLRPGSDGPRGFRRVLEGAIEREQPGKKKGLRDKAKDTRTDQ